MSRKKKRIVGIRTIQRRTHRLRKRTNIPSSSGSSTSSNEDNVAKHTKCFSINLSEGISCLDSTSLSSDNEELTKPLVENILLNQTLSIDPNTTDSNTTNLPINENENRNTFKNLKESGVCSLYSGNDFATDLKKWALSARIPHTKLKSLLSLLRMYNLEVPKDPRTLLKTVRKTDIKKCEYGDYMHFGLIESIENIIKKHSYTTLPDILNLKLGIDDVPVYNGISVTVILGCLEEIKDIFIIGCYKPNKNDEKNKDDPNSYIEDFVEEMIILETNGIEWSSNAYRVEFSKFSADAVAKSKILKQIAHNGFLSCTKCWVYGARKNRRTFFKSIHTRKRRDAEQKLLSTSILKNITSFQFVTKVPLDYMHLVCLGVVKTLLSFWTGNFGLGNSIIQRINKRINKFKEYTPSDFVRKPESFTFLSSWKATQYRQFLLYVGFAAIVNIVPDNILQLFLNLCVAIRIYCSNLHHLYDLAHIQIINFLEGYENIYGEEYLSHNLHNLIHLREDVELHGPLDNFSCFMFENFMQRIINDVRKPDNILQQIYRRQMERGTVEISGNSKEIKFLEHIDGPIVAGYSGIQYSKIKYKNFIINVKSNGDNCFFIKDQIVIAKNIVYKQNKYFIIGHEFLEKKAAFKNPIDSTVLNIFKCSKLSSSLQVYNIDDISYKLYRLPYKKNAFIVSPLLHFESETEY